MHPENDRDPQDPEAGDLLGEELGVEPEQVKLPPGIYKGITLFELEDGSFGFLPLTKNTTLMDAASLAIRIQTGIQADMVVQKLLATQKMMQQQAKPKMPGIIIPTLHRNK